MTENKNDEASKYPHRGTRGFLPNLLHLADTAMILAQRNSEWCGHGPVLEQDIAITNISLDLLGQARNFYQYAATVYNELNESEQAAAAGWMPALWSSFNRELEEDDLAFLRDPQQYLNLTICEWPKGDWAQTTLRQFLVSAFQHLQYTALQSGTDEQLAAIAEKSLKETTYHLRWSSEWVIRLGRGTGESKDRLQQALHTLWPLIPELFKPAAYEKALQTKGFSVDLKAIKVQWYDQVKALFETAGIDIPVVESHTGMGKEGRHSTHLSRLLEDMQYMQRTYPNTAW